MGTIQHSEAAIRKVNSLITAMETTDNLDDETTKADAEPVAPTRKRQTTSGGTPIVDLSATINIDVEYPFAPWYARAEECAEANPSVPKEQLVIPAHPLMALLTGAQIIGTGYTRITGKPQFGKSRLVAFMAADYMTHGSCFAHALESLVPEAHAAREVNVIMAYSEESGMRYLNYLPHPPHRLYKIHRVADLVPVLQYAQENYPSVVFVDSVSELMPEYIHPGRADEVAEYSTTVQSRVLALPTIKAKRSKVVRIPIHEIEWADRTKKSKWLRASKGVATSSIAMSNMGPLLSCYEHIPVIMTNHVATKMSGVVTWLGAKGGYSLQHLVYPDLSLKSMRGRDLEKVIVPDKSGISEEREVQYYPMQGGLFWGALILLGAAKQRHAMKPDSLGRGYLWPNTPQETHIDFNEQEAVLEHLTPDLIRRLTTHIYAFSALTAIPTLKPPQGEE